MQTNLYPVPCADSGRAQWRTRRGSWRESVCRRNADKYGRDRVGPETGRNSDLGCRQRKRELRRGWGKPSSSRTCNLFAGCSISDTRDSRRASTKRDIRTCLRRPAGDRGLSSRHARARKHNRCQVASLLDAAGTLAEFALLRNDAELMDLGLCLYATGRTRHVS